MRYVLLIIAAVWLALGITTAYAPEAVSSFLALEWITPWLKVMAALPLAIGAILLFGAQRFRLTIYLRIIGLLALLKGMFLLVAPAAYSRSMLDWYLGQPLWLIRVLALVSTALALVVAIIAIISLFEEDV